jgi:hypothetical protein
MILHRKSIFNTNFMANVEFNSVAKSICSHNILNTFDYDDKIT